jgi:hypothetical protein
LVISKSIEEIAVIKESTIPALDKRVEKVENTLDFIVSNDEEGLDSIVEFADWFNKHGAEVNEITSEIASLNDRVGDLPVATQLAELENKLRSDT